MDIFESTIKLKDYIKKNNQLVLIDKDNLPELSGFCTLPFLLHTDQINNVEDYVKKTELKYKYMNTIYDEPGKYFFSQRNLINSKILSNIKTGPDDVDTKEYWNFLHENFKFSDVASSHDVTNLESYFKCKGYLYDRIIDELGFGFFKYKKILEIGPGYGYLHKILKENNVPHTYYCADIVKRFNNDNFIEVDGYHLNINEKFDIVFMQDVIQHLGFNILKDYVTEIKSMLNDNGVLVIGTDAGNNDYSMHFFGQVYKNMGVLNLFKYLEDLNFKSYPVKYYTHNNSPIGRILMFSVGEYNKDYEFPIF